jgi:Fe2+ transport system protein FeoA
MSAINPTVSPASATAAPVATFSRMIKLDELAIGQRGRIVQVKLSEAGCRKRMAELGIAEGAKVEVISSGESIMLALGTSRIAISRRCASAIVIIRDTAHRAA